MCVCLCVWLFVCVCVCVCASDPAAREEVDLEVLVGVSQVSAAQRDTVVRQLAALLHVLDNSIQLRILPGHSPLR